LHNWLDVGSSLHNWLDVGSCGGNVAGLVNDGGGRVGGGGVDWSHVVSDIASAVVGVVGMHVVSVVEHCLLFWL
jgi:hypothetical protein